MVFVISTAPAMMGSRVSGVTHVSGIAIVFVAVSSSSVVTTVFVIFSISIVVVVRSIVVPRRFADEDTFY